MKKTLQSLVVSALLLLGGSANAQYIVHVAGNNVAGHYGDGGPAGYASLRCPTGVAIDSAGDIFIADGGPFNYENDGRVRRIDRLTGNIYTVAGMVGAPDSAIYNIDSVPATNARLNGCSSICFDKNGNLLIADGYSSVRKVNMRTGIITTVAGSRTTKGFSGDGGMATAALLHTPSDVTVDIANNIYIADLGNQVIRKVNALSGTITTVAGRPHTSGFSGDLGAAFSAKLNQPRGVFCDPSTSDLYISDYGNNRIRKVSGATGMITTIAGNGGPGFSGDGGLAVAAQLNQPARVTMDNAGNIYIADVANQRIRKITKTSTIITTYAGNGVYFSTPDTVGDNGAATSAAVVPYGMCFDGCGNMFLGGVVSSIRAITMSVPPDTILCGLTIVGVHETKANVKTGLTVTPNPNNGQCAVTVQSTINESAQIVVTDITGRTILETITTTNKETPLLLTTTPGMYFINATTAHGKMSKKIVVQ